MDAFAYPIFAYSALRTLQFRLQERFLNRALRLIPGVQGNLVHQDHLLPRTLEIQLRNQLLSLLINDAKNIREGIYPVSVLRPESPKTHLTRIPKILFDGFKIHRRRSKKISKDFSKLTKTFLDDVPDYFKRNFHFQTDGYLAESSADLYEHQVELLFAGAADAMRRLFLPLLHKHIEQSQFTALEVAAGTGRATRFMRLAFPKAKITCSDVSYPYLKHAQKKLRDLHRIDFIQANAEKLPFETDSFDVLYSVFLFHELPPEARKKVLTESLRVLKPGGYLAFVDSIQLHDFPEAQPALENFPVDFHEPFFKSYTKKPMEELLKEAGFEIIESTWGFLSKGILAQKKAPKSKPGASAIRHRK